MKTFKCRQIVIVGIAGISSQFQGRILRRATDAPGYWVVREIPADAERVKFLKSLPLCANGMAIHESQLAAVS